MRESDDYEKQSEGTSMFIKGMGVLGGFFPALRAARISPIQAMRG